VRLPEDNMRRLTLLFSFVARYDSGLLGLLSGAGPLLADVDMGGEDNNGMDMEDLSMALELTSEIILLEMIHRAIVCLYETVALYGGLRSEQFDRQRRE